jgi:hypothetical protein
MRADFRFVRRSTAEGLRKLTKANPTISRLPHRRSRSKVLSTWSVEAGRAQLSVQLLNFSCRYGCFAAGPRPYLLLAICLSALVNVVFASAEHIYARVISRKWMPREGREAPYPKRRGA